MNALNQVFETNDYPVFKKLLGNRSLNNLHIKRLKDSFQKEYLMAPIIVNEKMEIIDGQHRFEAAQELGLPIRYIIVQGYGLKEVQTLNTNMKNWKKEDYLDAYVDLGYEHYILFKQFMNEYPNFGIAACDALLTNRQGSSISRSDKKLRSNTNKEGKYLIRNFQEGNFEVYSYDLACANADRILEIGEFYDGYNRAVFIITMIGIFKNKNYDHDQFIKRLKANPTAMQHCGNVTQYKTMIEEIYNFRSREKVSFRY